MRTTLSVPRPFSLTATVDSHGWLWTHPFHPEPERGRLLRIEGIRGVPRRIAVKQSGAGGRQVRLTVTTDAPERDRDRVRGAVIKMLGLDEDLTGFYRVAASDPRLAALVDHGAGRTCRGTSLWEDATKGILQTNILWPQALRCIARVCTRGKRHTGTGLHAWPTPEELFRTGAAWLQREARIGYRAAALVRLAQEVATGERDLAALERRAPGLDTKALVAELQTIQGIGPATAHALAGFLGKHDVVSVDSSTVAYVRCHYPNAFRGARPTPAEVRAVFARYGPWQGKAWWYEAWLQRHMTTGPLDPR